MGETLRSVIGGGFETGTWGSKLGPLSGICMQGVLWTTLIGGALASALFTWPTDPFSVVGSGEGIVATAFNLGLVATGVLAVPFARWLWTSGRSLQGVLFGLTGVGFVLAGAFPMPSPLHEAAAGIFVGVWLLCWTAAIEDLREGARRIGGVQFALGTAAVAVWLPYDLGIERAMIGYGAAEAVAFGSLTAWTLLTVARGAFDTRFNR